MEAPQSRISPRMARTGERARSRAIRICFSLGVTHGAETKISGQA